MKAKTRWSQCRLRKKLSETSCSEMVSWLPVRYAVKNKILALRSNDEWSDGWQVISAGAESISDKEMRMRSSHHSNRLREKSDI